MSTVPEIPISELRISASRSRHKGGYEIRVPADDTITITHLWTRIETSATNTTSIHRARAEAMAKFEKAWAEYWTAKSDFPPPSKTFSQYFESQKDIAMEFHSSPKMIGIFKQFWEAALMHRPTSAERTLTNLGYTDCGGELWKPPLGKIPEQFADDHYRSGEYHAMVNNCTSQASQNVKGNWNTEFRIALSQHGYVLSSSPNVEGGSLPYQAPHPFGDVDAWPVPSYIVRRGLTS